jgi:hypothetical protein
MCIPLSLQSLRLSHSTTQQHQHSLAETTVSAITHSPNRNFHSSSLSATLSFFFFNLFWIDSQFHQLQIFFILLLLCCFYFCYFAITMVIVFCSCFCFLRFIVVDLSWMEREGSFDNIRMTPNKPTAAVWLYLYSCCIR